MNNKKSLIKKIKMYSRIKTFGVLPFSIMAIVSTVFFTIFTILSTWINISGMLIKILSFCMMSGLIVPILALSISERIRNNLIIESESNQEVFTKYLELFAKNEVKSNLIYYDLVDLFRSFVTKTYMHENKNEEISHFQNANNCMYRILQDNSNKGLANKFVYDNRQGFSKLCAEFIKYYNDNESGSEYKLDGALYNLYLKIKFTDNVVGIEKRQWDFHLIVRITKIILLLGCVSTYFFPQFNSWIFNLVAIILLLLDIIEKPKNY
ncbi:hypothetical protein [Clostridium weizhouense]|uniref:SMODS and SLOG-associating 2TM effector domain-containing protein n=1 Tax=Clostridium weizhouense TaxID=2859781 RepID=A0ABS7AUV7_9CLOT|nr:hypothetical protein [Clostridium weizhouense]MBW6411676.1 hypothetical protein [Clostridium weizhouense]